MSHPGDDEDMERNRRNDEALRRMRETIQNRSTPVHLDSRYTDKAAEDFRREQKGG